MLHFVKEKGNCASIKMHIKSPDIQFRCHIASGQATGGRVPYHRGPESLEAFLSAKGDEGRKRGFILIVQRVA